MAYHELSTGKDTSLSQVLSEWSKRYEEKFAALHYRFSGRIGEENHYITNKSRPRSADSSMPSYSELLEEIQSALQLKANLSVELEELQQIRLELEDTECMTEVHFRLERATEDNRRLHAALQMADEQITELVLSKRLLESQMNELRSNRDAELAEAKELVRAAERAVIAATRSSNSCKPVKDKPVQSTEPRVLVQQSANSNSTQLFMPLAFKKALQNRSRNYATLTAFSYEDFDSLDEDMEDEANKHLCGTIAAVNSGENNLEIPVDNKKSVVKTKIDIPIVANNESDTRCNQECPVESSIEDNVSSGSMDPVTSPSSSSVSDSMFSTHYLSSTSEKPLVIDTMVNLSTCANLSDVFDVLGWNSDLKTTRYIKQVEQKMADEVVSKADYLRVLDEMEELRHELDLLRQNALLSQLSLNNNVSESTTNNRPHLTSDRKLYNPGLTTQLMELKDEVNSTSSEFSSQKPNSLLPTLPPGSTRLYDWSLDKSDLQIDNEMSENKSGESETSADNPTPVKILLSPVEKVISHSVCLQTEHDLSLNDDEQMKNCTVCLEFYHKMILSIIDAMTKLKHELTTHVNDQYSSWMNNVLSLNYDMKHGEQEAEIELNKAVEELANSEVIIKTLRNEINCLMERQIELQHDYDTAYEMLMERENDLTRLNEQILKAENKCKSLSNQLLRRKEVILEQDEDLFLLSEDKIPFSPENQAVVYGHSKDFNPNNEEDYIRPMWATSVPKKKKSPNSTFLSSDSDTLFEAVAAELNILSNRLRDDSVRLATATEIASARQYVCDGSESITFNEPNDNEETTVKVEVDEYGLSIIEIRNFYGDLKAAVNEVTKIIHNNPWISKEQSNFEDNDEPMKRFMSRLLVSLTKALDTDEKLWVSAITSSVAKTCDKLRSRTTLSVPNLGVEFPSGSVLCQIIQQLTERISAFMRREDEFRKCLIEVLHVEEASFKSELKTHVNRSDALMEEINRLTEVINSLSEELNHANNRTNEMQSQLCDTEVDLVQTQHELQLKEDEVERQRTDVEQLRLQLCEENAQTEKFRSELEMLQSDKVQVEHELSSSNNLIQELKISLTNEKNRAQSLEIELDQLYDQIKRNIYHTILVPNNFDKNNTDFSSENLTGTDEIRTPNGCLSDINLCVYEDINLVTPRLASSQHDAIKFQNQVMELQATAHGLCSDLTEADLRLMPSLTSVLPDTYNLSNMDRASQSSVNEQFASKKKMPVYENQSESTVTKFAKLKNACVDLLPHISMVGRDDDDPRAGDTFDRYSNSHSSDDDSIEENLFIESGIMNSLYGELDGHRINAEHDECLVNNSNNLSGMLHKGSCRCIKTIDGRYAETLNNSQFPLCARCLRDEYYCRSLSYQERYLLLLLDNSRFSEDMLVATLGYPESRITLRIGCNYDSPQVGLSPAQRLRTIGCFVQAIHSWNSVSHRS
ncbi:unnamed protein product [Schistosoma turkestanicum]|nr:unnamed protein product [Schistosoma turkestanicum]